MAQVLASVTARSPPRRTTRSASRRCGLSWRPDLVIDTFGYNGTVPGPVLRLREDRQVSIDIPQRHRHRGHRALARALSAAAADGAMEEGSPMVEPGGTRRYTFAAKPAGTRWYHSHDVAGTDLTAQPLCGALRLPDRRAASDPGRYDREVLLAAHHWQGRVGQHAGHPPRSAAGQRPRGALRGGVVQRQDARPRRARAGARRRARAVSPAQRQPDPERHAGACRLIASPWWRSTATPCPRRELSTRCSSRPRNAPT